MKLLAIAYPEISKTDFQVIEDYRKQYDIQYKLIRPHFTFVFPVSDFTLENFNSEIVKQLDKVNSITFEIHKAIINKDFLSENYYIFLIPGKGCNRMIKLHDKLYNGKLKHHLHPEIKFTPHITIGSSKDKSACEKVVDEWNSKDFNINGKIITIDILSHSMNTVKSLRKINLLNT